jgi:hypothetical protein
VKLSEWHGKCIWQIASNIPLPLAGGKLQNLIFLLVSQNVFFRFFQKFIRPQSRMGCGSVG